MKNWNTVKLGDVCAKIEYGYTERASPVPVGPKFLRITDIVPPIINWETVPYCQISDDKAQKYKLEIGDIVIARTGATTGYNKTIKQDVDAVFASYLIRYRIDKKIADPFYVGYTLQSSSWFEYVNAIIGGSAQPGANAKQFAGFEFPLPPLSEQRRIVGILGCLDAKIELNRRMNANLEAQATAIFKNWFVDFEPFRQNGMTDSPLGKIPNGWHVAKLGECCEIHTKIFNPTDNQGMMVAHYSIPAFDASKTPVFELADVIKSNKYIVQEFSFLVSKLNPTTKRIWFPSPQLDISICSTEFIVFTANKPHHTVFFYSLVNDDLFQNQFCSRATGTTGSRQRVRPIDTLDFFILCPPDSIVDDFCQIVGPMLQQISVNIHESRVLASLRDTLLPRLMNGEI